MKKPSSKSNKITPTKAPRELRPAREIINDIYSSHTLSKIEYTPSWLSLVEMAGDASRMYNVNWSGSSFFISYSEYQPWDGSSSRASLFGFFSWLGARVSAVLTKKGWQPLINDIIEGIIELYVPEAGPIVYAVMLAYASPIVAAALAQPELIPMILFAIWVFLKEHGYASNLQISTDQKEFLAMLQENQIQFGNGASMFSTEKLAKWMPESTKLPPEGRAVLTAMISERLRLITNASCVWQPSAIKSKITPRGSSGQMLSMRTLDGYVASLGVIKSDLNRLSLLGLHTTPDGVKSAKLFPLAKADAYALEIAIDPKTGQTKFWANDKGWDMGILKGFKGGAHDAAPSWFVSKPGDHMLSGRWTDFAVALRYNAPRPIPAETIATIDAAAHRMLAATKGDTSPEAVTKAAAAKMWLTNSTNGSFHKIVTSENVAAAKWHRAAFPQTTDVITRGLALHHQIKSSRDELRVCDLRSAVV